MGSEQQYCMVSGPARGRFFLSGSSPVLFNDILIVNASEEARSIIRLNTQNGEELWKAKYDLLELCYATPVIVSAEVWVLHASTGKYRWYCEIGSGGNVSPTVVVGKESFFAFGGYPSQARTSSGKAEIAVLFRLPCYLTDISTV